MAPKPLPPAFIAGARAAAALALLQACTPLRLPADQSPSRAATPSCPHVPPPRQGAKPLPPVSAFPQSLQPGHWQARIGHKTPAWLDGYWEANGGACVWHNGRYLSGPPAR